MSFEEAEERLDGSGAVEGVAGEDDVGQSRWEDAGGDVGESVGGEVEPDQTRLLRKRARGEGLERTETGLRYSVEIWRNQNSSRILNHPGVSEPGN